MGALHAECPDSAAVELLLEPSQRTFTVATRASAGDVLVNGTGGDIRIEPKVHADHLDQSLTRERVGILDCRAGGGGRHHAALFAPKREELLSNVVDDVA